MMRLRSHPVRSTRRAAGRETAWNRPRKEQCEGIMGNSQGRDNVKKRAARRKKAERLALAATTKGKKKATK